MAGEFETVPMGHGCVTSYLSCKDTPRAIDWYIEVFGGREIRKRLVTPDGVVMNAELSIGGSVIMLAEEAPHLGSRSPKELGGTSVVLVHYVDDVDSVFQRALDHGAEEIIAVSDQFYGHRTGRLRDPFGHAWILATVIEDVPEDEMLERFDALFG